MKFDLQTSVGILCAVSALTYAGCTKETEQAKVQVVPAHAVTQAWEKNSDLVLTPKVPVSAKPKPSHAAHSSHVSHASHASSRF